MNNTAIYPGTFDPITHGHMDIIQRAVKCFDRLIIAVAENTAKNPCFDLSQRMRFIEQQTADMKSIDVLNFSGLLVAFAKQQNASVIVRGLRTTSDFDYECQLAAMNRQMAPELETMMMVPSSDVACISSSLVKEIASLGGDVSSFVAENVVLALADKYR